MSKYVSNVDLNEQNEVIIEDYEKQLFDYK